MDFKELFNQKLVTPQEAANTITSHSWVDYGWTVNTPVAVDAAIA